MSSPAKRMAASKAWVSAKEAEKQLGIDKKTLFKYRDDGTLKLGPHFASFPGKTFSRDSYQWNVNAVKRHLQKQGLLETAA